MSVGVGYVQEIDDVLFPPVSCSVWDSQPEAAMPTDSGGSWLLSLLSQLWVDPPTF